MNIQLNKRCNERLPRFKHYRDLIVILTQKEMKVRYKNTFGGYIWSVAHLLVFAFIFFMAFKVIMRIQLEGYAVFLIAGLFPWQWLSNSVNSSPMVFLLNASLIKKVNLPRNVLPLAIVLQDMIHFLPASLSSIRKSRYEALKDVSCEVKTEETFGIIGKNGAGKSTILGLIAGELKPTEDQVIVKGHTSALLELGAGFHPELTGRGRCAVRLSL